MATGKVEMTTEPPTRPLRYASEQEARFCSPSFKPRDDSEEREMNAAREAVAERLRKPVPPSSSEVADGTHPTQPQAVEVINVGDDSPQTTITKSTNRRAARRAKAEATAGTELDVGLEAVVAEAEVEAEPHGEEDTA